MDSGRFDNDWAVIDRTQKLSFSFDGREMTAHPGDTLASALLANGIGIVGRSPYLDRPRGILAAGTEEPNALVELELPTHVEPLARATTVEMFDGLVARARAGRGRAIAPGRAPRCDKRNLHCDVLVIGGGPSGLAAATAAADDGARVVVVDDRPRLGGAMLPSAVTIGLVNEAVAALDRAPEATVLTRTTALGLFDHGYAVLRQHLAPPASVGSERLWHVRARRVVLATGAIERPLVFADNDRPGIMLAHAAATYAARFAVRPGRRAVVFTVDDSAYEAAEQLVAAGVDVRALCDARSEAPPGLRERLAGHGVEVICGAAVAATRGDEGLEGVSVVPLDLAGEIAGPPREIGCDLLGVCGGWTPTLHLWAHIRGELRWDADLVAHVPVGQHPYVEVVGAAAGGNRPAVPTRALWLVPPLPGTRLDRHFVDLQRDATVADIDRAVAAGLRSPEHVKRYTTIGTGEDQGKTANVNALGILAGAIGTPLEQLSATTYRPPFVPVSFAALAGRDRGRLHDPVRTTPLHARHVSLGAVFENVGQWKRARYYPAAEEGMDEAVHRECEAVRTSAGLMDASTLGKIDVQGPDAAEFLDRVYTNLMSTLAVGMCRYGVLCRADGMIFDDGVVMRLAAERYVTTTTTSGAAAVLDWLEDLRQTEWPDLRVRLTSVTDHWATIAVAGPRSREIVGTIVPDVAVAAEDFPFMAIREAQLADMPVRLCRVSFSGELAFEIHTPARYGPAVWDTVIHAGRPHGIVPYGTEAMHVLRAEKGYVIVGQDTDGTVTPQDAAMGWVVSKKKDFFVGRRSLSRPDAVRSDRRQLVALLTEDPDASLPEGAQVLAGDGRATAGHVTSSYSSPALNRNFALALVEGGHGRHDEVVQVAFGEHRVAARVSGTVLYDPEGKRRDGQPA
jgi:sarcosine oxidase subunit alpha